MTHRRKLLAAAGATALVAVFPRMAAAQGAAPFPSKPIRIIIPYAPGGTTDIVGRRMGQRLSEILGQPVIIDNRSGANTAIGADAAAKSPADGHTLLFTNDATFVLNPVLFPALSYNVQRDFVPVAPVTYVALALVVNASTPANDMKELAVYAKSRKDLGYGSFGAGSQPHLMGEMFKRLTGADLVHVAYKGAGPAVTDVMGGQVLFTFPAFPTIQGHIASGKLKVLGVSGDKRVALLPNVPTFAEAGFKDMDIGAWYGFLAPAGTPREVVAKLNAAVNSILANRDFVEKNLSSQGMVPMSSTPEQMGALIRSETERMAAIVKKSGAKVE
ncbi:tripartite tricarboxylate transporter substrate binding protein [Polaromonas sp. SM01]|uniref:Bug family tripartite tricarboxylate transporter substrate binding protein n=1 Tax=Polaromonas sp. SM01 TaxID=3085630 RepID=UPI0029816881|nr:tripartite tricarboxylate transporter substrate binding protein [Polaromonas sp. SM01]MDW5442139.1 tripartite tricarboxylate transporter substrate binding protein [Polaromonas sp. SM01]